MNNSLFTVGVSTNMPNAQQLAHTVVALRLDMAPKSNSIAPPEPT